MERRLGGDYIDLDLLHWKGPHPVEENGHRRPLTTIWSASRCLATLIRARARSARSLATR